MSTIRWHSEPMVLRMAHAIARYIGFGEDEPTPFAHTTSEAPTVEPTSAPRPRLSLVAQVETREDAAGVKWRRHPQLRDYRAPLSEDVRTARHEAVRGLCAARSGASEVAINHFGIAARCDQVDLTAVPGFWTLNRGQMLLAVEAYEQADRYRDAAALDAHIATIFRPSLVGVNLRPIQPQPDRQKAAST